MSSAEESPRKIRTFIYGSCVSRDTFEFLPQDEYELVGYTARQSMISALTPGPDDYVVASDLTGFRRRVLLDDAHSSISASIPELASTIDLLLIDLTDERLGVYVDDDLGVVTRTVEGIASGIDQQLQPRMRHVPFATDEHYDRWRDAATAFADMLCRERLQERSAVLRVPWASTSKAGEAAPSSFGLTALDANQKFERYYRWLEDRIGIMSVGVNIDTFFDPEHMWGPAPFHFDAETYSIAASAITSLSQSNSAQAGTG